VPMPNGVASAINLSSDFRHLSLPLSLWLPIKGMVNAGVTGSCVGTAQPLVNEIHGRFGNVSE
jgi:hypothetical protein